MTTRSKNRHPGWESSGWWNRTTLSYFEPLLHFGSLELKEGNWEEAVWLGLGNERLCVVNYRTKEGLVQKRMKASDVISEVSADIGLGWVSPSDQEERIITAIQETILEEKRAMPKIFGQEPKIQLARQLQSRVKQVLDSIVAKTVAVERQREDKEGIAWTERSKENDVVFRLIGHPSDYTRLPWHCTHFAEYEEIVRMIRNEFGMPDTRHAVIHATGFLCFDDEGEDAARTLSWILMGLLDVVFNHEKAILKKCLFCEKYFFHPTSRPKKFCSRHCRYDHRNKSVGRDLSTSRPSH